MCRNHFRESEICVFQFEQKKYTQNRIQAN